MKAIKKPAPEQLRRVFPVITAFLLLNGAAALAANPKNVDVPVWYEHEGQDYYAEVSFEGVYYDAEDSNYDNCVTATHGYPYDHAHTSYGFPFMHHDRQVTAAKCKDYWDDYYTDYTYVSTATCAQNCHGYSTGHSYWVDATQDGVGRILSDDYVSSSIPVEGGVDVLPAYAHTIKVTAICEGCENTTEATTYEKYSSGPVYRAAAECPGGLESSGGAHYGPN